MPVSVKYQQTRQYKTWSADYGLGIKHTGFRYETQTMDWGLSLGVKRGLPQNICTYANIEHPKIETTESTKILNICHGCPIKLQTYKTSLIVAFCIKSRLHKTYCKICLACKYNVFQASVPLFKCICSIDPYHEFLAFRLFPNCKLWLLVYPRVFK